MPQSAADEIAKLLVLRKSGISVFGAQAGRSAGRTDLQHCAKQPIGCVKRYQGTEGLCRPQELQQSCGRMGGRGDEISPQ